MTVTLPVQQCQIPSFAEVRLHLIASSCLGSEDPSCSCTVWWRNLEAWNAAHDPGSLCHWVYTTYVLQERDPGWQRIWFCPRSGQRSAVPESCTETFSPNKRLTRGALMVWTRWCCSVGTPGRKHRWRSAAGIQYKKGCLVTKALKSSRTKKNEV